VFQLKDIEKLGVKKGVIAQAIKDVLQSLVDDNLVCCEKIGVRPFVLLVYLCLAFPCLFFPFIFPTPPVQLLDLSLLMQCRSQTTTGELQHPAQVPVSGRMWGNLL
jgi:hypothetical protein